MSNRVTNNNTKTIWVSIGLIFIIITLVFAMINILNSKNGDDFIFAIMAFLSLVSIVFISDGCKKYLWKEDYPNPYHYEDDKDEVEPNNKESNVE